MIDEICEAYNCTPREAEQQNIYLHHQVMQSRRMRAAARERGGAGTGDLFAEMVRTVTGQAEEDASSEASALLAQFGGGSNAGATMTSEEATRWATPLN